MTLINGEQIRKLEEQNAALSAQNEFLIGVLQSIGQSHLEDGESEAAESVLCHTRVLPAECLRQVRADAGRDGFIEGVEWFLYNFDESTTKAIAADNYHASILAGKE